MVKKWAPCTQLDFASVALQQVKTKSTGRRSRLALLGCLAVAWLIVIAGRLVSLQVTNVDTWQEWAIKQHLTDMELASERGSLLDRHQHLLAVSVPASSLYVRPKLVENRALAKEFLADALKMSPAEIQSKLSSPAPFVWLKRQIPRAMADRILEAKINGVGSVLEAKRYYPYKSSASALIGKVGIDGNGLSGLEAIYERHLHGKQVKTTVTRDAFGNFIQNSRGDSTEFELPRGDSLTLTIDAGLQLILDEELVQGKLNAKARAAWGVLMDASTGEVLAMGQAPSHNFNKESLNSKQDLKNLVVESVFEPGSILKPVVAAAAIEEGLISVDQLIDCERGRYPFGRHTIKDVHPIDVVSVHDVVVRSSNIGMTKIGLKLGRDRLYQYLNDFGFGAPSTLNLPGDTQGILRPVSSWAAVDVATHSFGQGVAVTPLQMARAMSALANGGVLPELKLVRDGRKPKGKRIISPATAKKIQEMLYGVVEDKHGTGAKATIEGVRVGGKTGTAQKARAHGRGYQSGAYVASFVGFVDASPLGIPKIFTLLISIDEPHNGSIYGGTLAAPVFSRAMQRMLYHLTTTEAVSTPSEREYEQETLEDQPDAEDNASIA